MRHHSPYYRPSSPMPVVLITIFSIFLGTCQSKTSTCSEGSETRAGAVTFTLSLKSHAARSFYKSASWQLQLPHAKIKKSRCLFHRSSNSWQQPVPHLLGEMSGSVYDLEALQKFGLDCLQLPEKVHFPSSRIYQHYLHLQTCHLHMLYIPLKKENNSAL